MNESELKTKARIENAKIKRVREAVNTIKVKKAIARGRIEDLTAIKLMEDSFALSI